MFLNRLASYHFFLHILPIPSFPCTYLIKIITDYLTVLNLMRNLGGIENAFIMNHDVLLVRDKCIER